MDIPSFGSKFTWVKLAGSACIKLENFLILEGIIEHWKIEGQGVGNRNPSDHCRILLKENNTN